MDAVTFTVLGEKGETNNNPVGVAESFVNWGKRVIQWGFVRVDDSELISKELAREVLKKCAPLQVKLLKNGMSTWFKHGHGHGGFIRGEILQSSPGRSTAISYSVYPITARHNLRCVNEAVSDGPVSLYRPMQANLALSDLEIVVSWGGDDLGWQPTKANYLNLREGEEARPVICKFGFDVSIGSVIAEVDNPACAAMASFERVREDFKLEKGQKVGMAVLFTDQTKPTPATIVGADEGDAAKDFGESEIKKFYGEPGKVTIYTGEIKYVGPKHIEYNINSFSGCAGAIVFLLDEEQPVTVEESDWGKAVAVHAGAHPSMIDRNYGFLINEHPMFHMQKS